MKNSSLHETGWALFDTALGKCAMAWGPRGIVAIQLPELDAAATQERLICCTGPLPQALPPADVAAAMRAVADLLDGKVHDFSRVVLDTQSVTPFQQRVYALALCIAPGQTRTYGELAQALGGRHLARAVGQALGRNPFAPIVPCHRVLAAHGRMGGFSAHGGAATKLRMLLNEGWQPRAGAGAGAGADSVKGTAPLFEEEEILAKALPALPG